MNIGREIVLSADIHYNEKRSQVDSPMLMGIAALSICLIGAVAVLAVVMLKKK